MQSKQVIRNYQLIAGIYTLSASLIWGVNTLFLLNAGLDIFSVFIVNSVFTGAMALFEIPTGVLADTRGRRISFLLSVIIVLLGTLGYILAAQMVGSLLLFSAMSVILGLGYTFYSGAVEAWLVDALIATNYEGELDRVFARGSMVSGAAMLIGTTLGGLLGSIDLAFPYWGRAVLLAIVFVISYFTMHDLGFEPRTLKLTALPAEMIKIARSSITYGWKERPMRLFMMVSFLQSGFMAWGFYAWQPYFLDLLGRDAVWVAGGVAALIALSTIIGNSLVEWFSRYCGKRTTLLLWASGALTVSAIGVGLAQSFWVAVALFLIGTAATGVIGPVKQGFLHKIIPSEQRASVISFDSLVGSSGSVFGQTGLGYLSKVRSIAEGYMVGSIINLFALPVIFLIRRLDESADNIVGKCGKQGASAGQGLPEVSTVDATPRQAGS